MSWKVKLKGGGSGKVMDHSNPVRVTVWCTTYNQKKYIRSAIESFVSQITTFRYEVIVHDDASTDGTDAIVREYAEKYPDLMKPIFEEENQYSKGENFFDMLAQNASGDYFAYCEGDDFWCDPHKLQKQFDAMEANPSAFIATNVAQCLNEDGSLSERTIPPRETAAKTQKLISQDDFARLLFTENTYPFHTSSYFVRREILERPELKQLKEYLNTDKALLHTALLLGDVFFIDEIMSCRRLFTEGNYNLSFNAKPSKEKIDFFMKSTACDIFFDALTGGKYRKYLICHAYSTVTSLAHRYGGAALWPRLIQLLRTFRYSLRVSAKLNAKVLTLLLLPHAYRGIFSLFVKRRP